MKKVIVLIIVAVLLISTAALGYLTFGYRNWDVKTWDYIIDSVADETTPCNFDIEIPNTTEPKIENINQNFEASDLLFSFGEASVASDGSVSRNIEATIYPSRAENKELDWNIVWENSATTLTISEYVDITPLSDGGNKATITCYKAFPRTEKLIVSARTRIGGLSAECFVVYKGIPSVIEVTGAYGNAVNNGIHLLYEETGSHVVGFLKPNNIFKDVHRDYFMPNNIFTYSVKWVGNFNVIVGDTVQGSFPLSDVLPYILGLPGYKQFTIGLDYDSGYSQQKIRFDQSQTFNLYQDWQSSESKYFTSEQQRTQFGTAYFNDFIDGAHFYIEFTHVSTGLKASFKFVPRRPSVQSVALPSNSIEF